MTRSSTDTARRGLPAWAVTLRRFEETSAPRAAWQLGTTLVAYLALLALMAWTVERGLPYWLTLALAVPTGGLMVRLFIFFHDCTHGSFVASPRLRRLVGRVLGVMVFTPFEHWGHAHRTHHATSGNLDRRGVGDVPMLTVDEYLALSPGRRRLVRLLRHPLVMFGLGPIWVFGIVQRIPRKGPRRQRLSVLYTNLTLAGVVLGASLTVGLGTYVAVQLPVLWIGGMGGVWLFYVQHQFEPSYWARTGAWSPVDAALRGSSYYKLPKVLQWFSGNIGLHHVHHLRPRIPNYHLQACHDATPELQAVAPLTLAGSLRCLRIQLWDEAAGRFTTFRAAAQAEPASRVRSSEPAWATEAAPPTPPARVLAIRPMDRRGAPPPSSHPSGAGA